MGSAQRYLLCRPFFLCADPRHIQCFAKQCNLPILRNEAAHVMLFVRCAEPGRIGFCVVFGKDLVFRRHMDLDLGKMEAREAGRKVLEEGAQGFFPGPAIGSADAIEVGQFDGPVIGE